MIDSVRQVHTDECGNLDKSRGGVGGKNKHRRAFLEVMRSSGKYKFEMSELQGIADKVNLPLGMDFRGESFDFLFDFASRQALY